MNITTKQTFDKQQPSITICKSGRAFIAINEQINKVKEVAITNIDPNIELIKEETEKTQYVYDTCWLDDVKQESNVFNVAKKLLLDTIDKYYSSNNVKMFLLDDQYGWLDKDTRMGLRQNIADRKLGGLSNIVIWISGKPHSMTLERAENFLRKVEDYAYTCKAVTYQHKTDVENLTTLNDILQYNYTKDYPTIIIDKIV